VRRPLNGASARWPAEHGGGRHNSQNEGDQQNQQDDHYANATEDQQLLLAALAALGGRSAAIGGGAVLTLALRPAVLLAVPLLAIGLPLRTIGLLLALGLAIALRAVLLTRGLLLAIGLLRVALLAARSPVRLLTLLTVGLLAVRLLTLLVLLPGVLLRVGGSPLPFRADARVEGLGGLRVGVGALSGAVPLPALRLGGRRRLVGARLLGDRTRVLAGLGRRHHHRAITGALLGRLGGRLGLLPGPLLGGAGSAPLVHGRGRRGLRRLPLLLLRGDGTVVRRGDRDVGARRPGHRGLIRHGRTLGLRLLVAGARPGNDQSALASAGGRRRLLRAVKGRRPVRVRRAVLLLGLPVGLLRLLLGLLTVRPLLRLAVRRLLLSRLLRLPRPAVGRLLPVGLLGLLTVRPLLRLAVRRLLSGLLRLLSTDPGDRLLDHRGRRGRHGPLRSRPGRVLVPLVGGARRRGTACGRAEHHRAISYRPHRLRGPALAGPLRRLAFPAGGRFLVVRR